MKGFSAIAVRLGEDAWWVLSTAGCPEMLDPSQDSFPEIRPGLRGHAAAEGKSSPIVMQEPAGGGMMIRLLETWRYEWDVLGREDVTVKSTLETLPGRNWSIRRTRGLSGSFAVVNHLGMGDFTLEVGGVAHRFALEIVSEKLDYHTEFRQITEDIANFCQQVLLDWDAPTSLGFHVDAEKAARLRLEQFLFLRSHLQPERLVAILESVQRRPNSTLVRDQRWTPSACAGSNDWLRDPVRMARDWRRTSADARALPAQVLDVRKEDSVDTPANRFVKFALVQFRDMCREVVEKHASALSLAREAQELGDALDAVLGRPFFRDLGNLNRLPLDNPTLQKRDGYRQILRAWLLTQSAAALNWEQDDDNYHGPTRNVATLYEYWIFLQLHQILDEISGVSRDLDNPKPANHAEPFLQTKGGELVINLKRGKTTCAPFTIRLQTGLVLKLHLYYERTFQLQRGATDAASYSRQFKPDYTLAIFPERFADEDAASEEGQIAYVHFDAKYRAENLKSVFGGQGKDESELDTDKLQGKATSTYERGDLLKMHTYNDAVRQTAGSYVLYPGSDEAAQMSKFHEILPGVGAFVLKPGNTQSRNALKDFLADVFRHQADQFTQFRHFSDVRHATVREEPVPYGSNRIARPSAACIMVWLPENKRELCRKTKLAYCRALKDDGTPIRIQVGNLSGAVLCPYRGPRGGQKLSLDWLAPVLSCEMMSKESLSSALASAGWPQSEMPSEAMAYLLFKLGEPMTVPARDVTHLVPVNGYHARSRTLRELGDCSTV